MNLASFRFLAGRSVSRGQILVALASGFLLLAGCGRSSSGSLASTHEKEFKSATGEVKAAWDTVVAGVKANDYAATLTAVAKLANNPALTPEQSKALSETATAVSDEMYDKANKGDEAAKQALQTLKAANAR